MFTIANLTQFGGGAVIAPHAEADDGLLELIYASDKDTAVILANIVRLFDGTIRQMPGLKFRQFRAMTVRRPEPKPIQIDGELVDAPEEISIKVLPKCLNVLVPQSTS
jgi:diacylglycerol kinase family enzyme